MNKLHEYKKRIEGEIAEYAEEMLARKDRPLMAMMECYNVIDSMDKHTAVLSPEDIDEWNKNMHNEDGTVGGHWTVDQTTAVAQSMGVKFEHISEMCWNVTMNMMYADYYGVAAKYGINAPDFYADMAKAFLFDKDAPAPREKLAAYYHGIAKA